MIRRRSLQLAALALVLAVLLWCAGPAHGQPVVVPIILSTVADLPASSTVPRLVSDGASSSDCTTGGGSTFVWCYWTGAAWAAFGDGGGAGGSGDVTAVGDCATGGCFQVTTARHAFLSPAAGGVATFRAITEADVSDLGAYLLNIVEDTTPQLGGALDAQGNDITSMGDITFQSGATGGTLRTGTSAADLFKLQAYDVDGGTYRDMLELDAGNVPVMSLLHVTEIDIDAGGAIRTGTLAGETALIQARDVDGAAWTTFGTLTANDTPTFDLSTATTVGGATIQTGVDDTGTDTLDDLSDDDLGALQNVSETGEGAGIPLVGDGAGGWAPAAATGCLSNGTNCPADDDVPEAADYSNLTAGTAITNSPTGTINLDTTASPAITGDWDFGGGGIEIENGITPPVCTVGQLYLDTDATSGQQLMACEAGTFVLQGDGGGAGGASITAGDSSVEVVDAGTGAINFTLDATLMAHFDAGGDLLFDQTGTLSDLQIDLSGDGSAAEGIYSNGTDFFIKSGGAAWKFTGTAFSPSTTGRGALLNEVPSSTNPTLNADSADPDTGVGKSAAGGVSLIDESTEVLAAESGKVTITDVLTITPRASAPASCSIGDIYVDTSGAACTCSATNTWESMNATGSCV